MEKCRRWIGCACVVVMLMISVGVAAEPMADSDQGRFDSAGGQTESNGEGGLDFRRSMAGAFFGYDFETEDPLLGVEGRFSFDVVPNIAVSLNPAFSYYFMSDRQVFGVTIESRFVQFDVNALGHLIIDGPIEPYLGLGMAIQHARVRIQIGGSESTDSETSLGLNIVAGTEINIDGPLVPFAHLRFTVAEVEEVDHANFLALMGGLAYSF